ncbi:methyltransferase, putative [Plasmodium vinckei brucechwatti]|uniref:2-methoxy-6-polyprenyl-1,4-benzoquinol methylase, mitochondrial n=1 Tax=Plasmodium vinckei brucechwatti TaxID=119398 RepID=A0A6V7RWE4_PLAVN|nr:methyltransferase, putative [Plasmodium vinckei brucechwatti]
MAANKICTSYHHSYYCRRIQPYLLRNGTNLFMDKGKCFYTNERLYNFGFQKVTEEIKSKLVYNLFSKVSNKYDIMNDLMSFRLHRCWKDQFIKELDLFLKYQCYNTKKKDINDSINVDPYNTTTNDESMNQNISSDHNEKIKNLNAHKCKILDLAGGTGDIAFRILERYKYFLEKIKIFDNKNNYDRISEEFYKNPLVNIIVCDVNNDMINVGIERAKNLNLNKNITWLVENAEDLKSIEDNSIDIITLSFGIRNFTNISKALSEMYRVLKPGGRLLCLEFSKVECNAINIFYKFYLNNYIPLLGKYIANNEHAYKYLAESIQTFLTPDELSQLMHQTQFKNISYTTMTFGIVAIHSAYKLN